MWGGRVEMLKQECRRRGALVCSAAVEHRSGVASATESRFLPGPQTGSPRSRCGQGWSLPKAERENLSRAALRFC